MTESKKNRILIVEDRKTNAEVIHFYLTEEGYEIKW
ncbi:MAG: response regulator [Methanospirillum sp.]|nr:response regulator [Methanospirillum sp.]